MPERMPGKSQKAYRNQTLGRRAVRFLWIEDWFGNMWQFRDGVNIKNRQHYCCNKRASYADDTYTGDYQKLGYVCPTNEGYIKRWDSTACIRSTKCR